MAQTTKSTAAQTAVEALLTADTARGTRFFLDQIAPIFDDLPEVDAPSGWSPATVEVALDGLISSAVDVARAAEAKRWKMAVRSLAAVWMFQEAYRVRLHARSLTPTHGTELRGHVREGKPQIEVWSLQGGGLLMVLPPTASQEAVDAAAIGWRAGYKRGAHEGMRQIKRTVDYVTAAA